MLNSYIWLPKHVYGRYWVVSVPIWRPIKVPNGPKIGLIAFFIISNVLNGLLHVELIGHMIKSVQWFQRYKWGPSGYFWVLK